MNLVIMPGSAPEHAADTHLQNKHIREWLQLLGDCAEKPSRRRVHAVRVATLRLLTMAEESLATPTVRSDEAVTVQHWIKQATRLRGALSTIREIDVYRSRLAQLRTTLEEPGSEYLHIGRELAHQVDQLDDRFKQSRKKAAKKLVAQIAARAIRLRELSDVLGDQFPVRAPAFGASSLASRIAGLTAGYTEFTEENLHAFRKRIRQMRYVIEAFHSSDRVVRQVARMLRRLQVAIGTWHDWAALAFEARKVRHDSAGRDSLVALLDELAGESLSKALHTCARTMDKLGKLHTAESAPGQSARKRPVQRTAEPRSMVVQRRA
jgi:CHAD domain-containing protein